MLGEIEVALGRHQRSDATLLGDPQDGMVASGKNRSASETLWFVATDTNAGHWFGAGPQHSAEIGWPLVVSRSCWMRAAVRVSAAAPLCT
jgi:hypothetical protein